MSKFFGKTAVLLSVQSDIGIEGSESINELEELCKTLDITTLDKVIQRRNKPDPVFYFGIGKLEKVKEFCRVNNVDLLVVDDELTPIQQRNVEKFVEVKTVDRTQIILEIFSRHATTAEGKLQVEMARLVYELPRLRGKGLQLSNQGGGIGTRGPGEKMLELDRRKIKNRIVHLKDELNKLKTNRENIRKSRTESGYYIVSITGYTNAGKSTLLSALSGEKNIIISERLFATLNPTTRRVVLPGGRVVLFSDTVGFIKKLPHTLIEAFHSTLEEILYSDIIVILVDVSDPFYRDKISASYNVLEDIGVVDKEVMIVFNKIDLVPDEYLQTVRIEYPDAVFISAKSGLGLSNFLNRIVQHIHNHDICARIKVDNLKKGIIMKFSEFVDVEVIDENESYTTYDVHGPEKIVERIAKSVNFVEEGDTK
ncbi:MAG TPA: GTPase HflX [Fervidobacterium sp.]|nr:GTPase HflX [Fervidobacterium sp.]